MGYCVVFGGVALFGCLAFVSGLVFDVVLCGLAGCWFRLVFIADLCLVVLLRCVVRLLVVCFGWYLFVVVCGWLFGVSFAAGWV